MPKPARSSVQSWFIPIGIVVIAGLLITLIILQLSGTAGGQAASAEGASIEPTETDFSFVETREEGDVQAAGPTDAPVGMVVYSDYQCPFCARWTNDTLPELMPYAERGDLRIEWRDVNQYGENSERAALAAHAAGLQGKFWEYHALLFPDGGHLQPEQLTEEALIDLAQQLGLDAEQFAQDLTSSETQELIQQYAAQGRELGVSGPPTFVLGGEPIVGAQPPDVFIDALHDALAKAR